MCSPGLTIRATCARTYRRCVSIVKSTSEAITVTSVPGEVDALRSACRLDDLDCAPAVLRAVPTTIVEPCLVRAQTRALPIGDVTVICVACREGWHAQCVGRICACPKCKK